MMLIRAERLVTASEVYEPGLLRVEGDRVVEVGAWTTGTPDLAVGTLAPGLVDVHHHGGGTASFSIDPETAIWAHRRTGTTTQIASLVTETYDDLEAQVRMLAPYVEAGELAGIHLEGPWLAAEFHGAHPVPLLRDPLWPEVERLLDAGPVKMVTVAVERTGGIEACRRMAARGVVAAIGHTNADYETSVAALDAGASGATHLFNAMKPIHHRQPGPIVALMEHPTAWLELIVDGTHSHPALVKWVAEAYPGRIVLVTDAMAAAGADDGDYILGTLAVEVRGGVAKIAGTDTIAGSTLTLSKAVANAVAFGVDPLVAVRAATIQPARYLSLDAGDLRVGGRADAVVLDDTWTVTRVMRKGEWLA
jgi:N-acetylglucosamine-6-phosphate deacetylase